VEVPVQIRKPIKFLKVPTLRLSQEIVSHRSKVMGLEDCLGKVQEADLLIYYLIVKAVLSTTVKIKMVRLEKQYKNPWHWQIA
jgi:hypothetical protein